MSDVIIGMLCINDEIEFLSLFSFQKTSSFKSSDKKITDKIVGGLMSDAEKFKFTIPFLPSFFLEV